MSLPPQSLWSWSLDDVGRWLCSINMSHLVHKFEVAGVNGEVLCRMDDGYIPSLLKLNPGEKITLIGAIKILKDSYRNSYHHRSVPQEPPVPPHGYGRPRTQSDEKKKTKKPSTSLSIGAHTSLEIESMDTSQLSPEYKVSSATELLDDNCRHSGWVRKRGGGYRNWKRRYLILRLGFAYYYENENATKPKGSICLHNCSVSPCTEEDRIKNHKWVFKVVPDDPKLRTFYITTAARHEMEKWIQVINEEIDRFNMNYGDDEEDYEHIYDPVHEDDDDEDDNNDPLYEGVAEEEEPPYTRIRDTSSVSLPSPRLADPRLSPTHRASTLTWQVADHTKPRQGKGDAPVIPPRSARSLMDPGSGVKPDPPPIIPSNQVAEENPYLRIVGSSEPMSPSPVITNSPPAVQVPPLPPSYHSSPPHLTSPTEMSPSDERQAEIEEEDPYYIRLQTLEEVLPQYCIFGNIPREEAESGLSRTGRVGTYLLRDGRHKNAKYVLSVLAGGDLIKHYKLYQKEDQSFCLTEGKLFPSLPQLIEYYKQVDLPRTPDVKLSEPYHPLDH